ncbi:structural maintenance of chromosomes protein 6-like [Homarus americanus]|uniref:structural maintenance of chromosomes protein 6-like n=1 Tax=Homarus americanus TaxID=6706 RepID=UPI001C47271B|nr:structural maintenance of chromosomes protein 6-like [Homarus americanus]
MSAQRSQDEDDPDEISAGPSRKRHKSAHVYSNNISSSLQLSQQEQSASSGILEYVTVKNFMCLDNMMCAFSPQINLVQGRNGSGKSAILTAIIVGLGGSSRTTNRGNNLKELVKYGKQSATIEIALKNSGRDAYKLDLYGDMIIVERKIQANGGGGRYKLKAKDGNVSSLHKLYNYSEPQALYKFFLKATQLQQMNDDYNELEKALKVSLDIIEDRKED